MNKKGFTLIELMVVMAIIAILSAIIFPIMATAREQTEKSTCMNNMRQIGMALDMFHSDNKVYPSGLAPEPEYDAKGNIIPFEEAVGNLLQSDYVQNYTIFHCPTDDRFEDTKSIVHAKYSKNNVTIEKDVYTYSSYDVYLNSDETSTTTKNFTTYTDDTAVLCYLKEWQKKNSKGKIPDEDDYPRQLKWKNSPSNTVVCFCFNHADYPFSSNQTEYPTKGATLVLFLDGHVDVYVDTKQVAGAMFTIEPNHYEK